MKMLHVNFILTASLYFGLNSCIQNGCANNEKIYRNILSQKIEYRDSLFILYTFKEWGNLNWQVFSDYSIMYKITNNEVEYRIEKIFYSSDKKKMIAWASEKLPNATSIENYNNYSKNNRVCPLGGDTILHIGALIGFRDSQTQIWKIYPFNEFSVECAANQETAINLMKQYYFDKMKDDGNNVNKKFIDKNFGGKVRYDIEKKSKNLGYNQNTPFIVVDFGYNLQDKYFWEKSLIWQKGARIPGLYNFQTKGNVTPDEKDVELIPPKINYPDSILYMYK